MWWVFSFPPGLDEMSRPRTCSQVCQCVGTVGCGILLSWAVKDGGAHGWAAYSACSIGWYTLGSAVVQPCWHSRALTFAGHISILLGSLEQSGFQLLWFTNGSVLQITFQWRPPLRREGLRSCVSWGSLPCLRWTCLLSEWQVVGVASALWGNEHRQKPPTCSCCIPGTSSNFVGTRFLEKASDQGCVELSVSLLCIRHPWATCGCECLKC
jgi:hypothetical protein